MTKKMNRTICLKGCITEMRVLFLGFSKIAFMPYMHLYLNQLNKDTMADLVYWERDGLADSEVPKVFTNIWKYCGHIEESEPIKKKMLHFYRYRKIVLKVLQNDNLYDLIVVLHSTTGLPVLDILIKKYKGKYILDYRDFSHENIDWYKKLVGKLARNAKVVCISSSGFFNYLPVIDNIYPVHNYLADSLNHRNVRKVSHSRTSKPIKLRYWGLIRHIESNLAIINAVKNDSCFELHYHGREQGEARSMIEYCKSNNISNVYFHGLYKPEERYNFAADTDLLLNTYNNDKVTINATGNKYYDGIIFYIPQICTQGSLMGNIAAKNHVGIVVDLSGKNLKDDLINYYNRIVWEKFESDCDLALENIICEQNSSNDIIRSVINGYKD